LFHTNSYTRSEVELLCKVLQTKFDLQCKPRKPAFLDRQCNVQKRKGEGQYAIYISASSQKQFISIVKPYIHPSMLYKLE
jgi:hypothetical protein